MSYPLEKLGYNLNKKFWTGDALINNPDIIKNIQKNMSMQVQTSSLLQHIKLVMIH